jgi:hypothetical protein
MHPVIALLNAGVLMDVIGIGYENFTTAQRNSVIEAYPRGASFEERLIQTFYDGIKHSPDTTYGTINADILVAKDPNFRRIDMRSRILHSRWRERENG